MKIKQLKTSHILYSLLDDIHDTLKVNKMVMGDALFIPKRMPIDLIKGRLGIYWIDPRDVEDHYIYVPKR